MITDKYVFDAAKAVVEHAGTSIYPQDLDTFFESAKRYIDPDIEILYIKQLTIMPDHSISSTERVIIKSPDLIADMEQDPEEDISDFDSWYPYSQPCPVFDYAVPENGPAGSFLYIPGPWLNKLRQLYKVTTPAN